MESHVAFRKGGIECDSISALNAERADNFDCAQQKGRSTRTGSTARSALDFVEARLPPAFPFERVQNLAVAGKSGAGNLEFIIKRSNSLGYYVVHLVIDSLCFGVPRHRERFYLLGVKVHAKVDQYEKDHQALAWATDMLDFIRNMYIGQEPLVDFLIHDPKHPDILEANAAIEETPKEKKKAAAKAKARGEKTEPMEYKVDHLGHYTQSRLQWPPKYDEDFKFKSARLSERPRQTLWHEERVLGEASQLEELQSRDLNLSMAWGKSNVGALPCIVSSSRIWCRGPLAGDDEYTDRLLAGSELHNIQGFDSRGTRGPPRDPQGTHPER